MHWFISHATTDAAQEALQLALAMEAAGTRAWVAPRDVKPGRPYPGQIVAAIRDCAGLVLLISPAANLSRDVLQEVERAHAEHKTIIPVVINATAPSDDLSYYVRVRQRLVWSSAADITALVLEADGAKLASQKRFNPSLQVLTAAEFERERDQTKPEGKRSWPPDPHQKVSSATMEDPACRLMRDLGIEPILRPSRERYPVSRDDLGPAPGYRYWATHLSKIGIVQFGCQRLSNEAIALHWQRRLNGAGFKSRPNGREMFVEIRDYLGEEEVEKARQAMGTLKQALKP